MKPSFFEMKGVVFSKFIKMVEERYSLEIADQIIAASELEAGGVYTTVGAYDHRELLRLAKRLSLLADEPISDMLTFFGDYLFDRFAQLSPTHFQDHRTAFDFLAALEGKIHFEVKMLYPDAELPHFQYLRPTPACLVLFYRSRRPLGDLAEGLIKGCIRHFGQTIALERDDLPCDHGAHIRFILKVTDHD